MPDTFPVTFHGFSKSHGAIALILQIKKRGVSEVKGLVPDPTGSGRGRAAIQGCLFLNLCSLPQPSAVSLKAEGSSGSGMTNCSGFSRKQGFLERGTFSAELEKVLGKPEGVGRFVCSVLLQRLDSQQGHPAVLEPYSCQIICTGKVISPIRKIKFGELLS